MNILFFTHPGTNSKLIFEDIIQGYVECGHTAFKINLSEIWKLRENPDEEVLANVANFFTETVRTFIKENDIDLCICMWANAIISLNMFEDLNFFENNKTPILMHWLDAPQWAHGRLASKTPEKMFNGKYSFHYINNLGTAQEMEKVLKFKNIIALPNASNPLIFKSQNYEKKYDICFSLGEDNRLPSKLMLRELDKEAPDFAMIRKDEAEKTKQRLISLLDSNANSFCEAMIQLQLENPHETFMKKLRICTRGNKDYWVYRDLLYGDKKLFIEFSMALRSIENWERKFTFCWLTRHFNMVTFGGCKFDGWNTGNYTQLGFIDYEDQAKVYGQSHFGLNIMRWQDDIGLNLKPFEITLSGTCLLQSYRKGIEDLFADNEIITYRDSNELLQTVKTMLKEPESISNTALLGQQRSLKSNCWKHRAQGVIQHIFPENTSDE